MLLSRIWHRKLCRAAAGLFLLLWLIFPLEASAGEPQIEATSAVLMDALTGQVLWSKNPHERLPQASTTKITTAIVALERGKLTDLVRASKKAAEVGEASIYLEEGETLTLEELIYALLLRSANDAAVAIAEHIGGTEEEFVNLMNAKAREIGAENTHYANPHGLSAPGHYSSAYDLALIARYALQNPKFREIVATKEAVIPWPGKPWDRLLVNNNQLLWGYYEYPGADGVKTGYTREAGQVLVASATREGRQLIAVVMHSPNRYREASLLLDYGFEHFTRRVLMPAGETVAMAPVSRGLRDTVPAVTAGQVVVAVPKDVPAEWQQDIEILPGLTAPLKQGDKVGTVVFRWQDHKVAVDLVAGRDIREQPWWLAFIQAFINIFHFPWVRLS
ncbi:MAG: D-alanyl-D-alanine carboxypeptidase [Thermoanaerobacteraceae bacterium]|nr:D-alanyl-D-alanine carboxypeptidase [Thermoanaerobacteraceae bacterium]